MRLFDLEIEGQTAILQKRKVRELITREPLPEGHPLRGIIKGDAITSQDLKRIEVIKAIADYSAYRNGHGCFFPAAVVRHSLIEGARKAKIKSGRATIWKNLQGVLFPAPAEILILRDGKELPTYDCLLDSLPRGMSGVVLQYQAQIKLPWMMRFQLLMLDDNITEENLKDVVNGAGLYAGIGAWISGGYGRFRLASFELGTLPDQGDVAGLLQPA